MAQLRRDHEQFIKRVAEVIVVGPDNKSAFQEYWRKESLPFIGLPDPKGIVLSQYGQEVNLLKLGRMPAQILVDRNGIARFVHYGSSMADISDNNELLELLDELNQEINKDIHSTN